MIQIKYCGACGDQTIVNKLEKELKQIEEVQKIECGRCHMEVKANGQKIFNETEDIIDITGIKEKAKQAIGA